MKMNDIGTGEKIALLVHPMLADADIVKELIADRMGEGWRFLIPDLSGHGSSRKFPFTELAKEADDIHSYMQNNEIRHLDFVWGASLGAAVAFALQRYVDASFGTMVLDGTPFMKTSGLITNIIVKKMIRKHRKAQKDRDLSVRKMTELYGAAGPGMAEEMINIDEVSLESIMRSCGGAVYPVLSEEQQKHTAFIFGEKDYNVSAARKKVPEDYPLAELRLLPGYGHCGMIGKDPDGYVELIMSFMK